MSCVVYVMWYLDGTHVVYSHELGHVNEFWKSRSSQREIIRVVPSDNLLISGAS
jgi:hypothetical protein